MPVDSDPIVALPDAGSWHQWLAEHHATSNGVWLHIAKKAFWPARLPFPVMHVDTGHNFDEIIEFRDRTVERVGAKVVHGAKQRRVCERLYLGQDGAVHIGVEGIGNRKASAEARGDVDAAPAVAEGAGAGVVESGTLGAEVHPAGLAHLVDHLGGVIRRFLSSLIAG